MPSSSPTPEPTYESDEFEVVTRGIRHLTPWMALFNEAEEILRESHPDGFQIEDIGRAAFDSLPEQERDAALDELFYTYWAARQSDRELRAAREERAS